MKFIQRVGSTTLTSVLTLSVGVGNALGLPPPEDTPEEVLRTEIITEARSPVDGKPMSAAEYAQLQAQLREDPFGPQLDPKIRELIFLLRIRSLLRSVGLPIP